MFPQITSTIEAQLHHLEKLQIQIKKALGKSPEGNLRISKSNGCFQYFHIKEPNCSKGEYIPRKKRNLARSLAQKDYDSKLLPLIDSEIKLLQHYLQKSREEQMYNLYPQLHPARKNLTTPFYIPDEEYVSSWLAAEYPRKAFSDDTAEHYTDTGLRVRSKSEVIIANKLSKLDIPFRYEASLEIKISRKGRTQVITYHPDFTCLNKRTRQEFVWEHFGMMDNPEYACKAVERERAYTAAGFIHGINFITTTETTSLPLNNLYVEQIAKKLLL